MPLPWNNLGIYYERPQVIRNYTTQHCTKLLLMQILRMQQHAALSSRKLLGETPDGYRPARP
jgi:hypothetical protein